MSCRLIQNIKHSCDYNPGGITNIYLLDSRDFISYKFSDDKLYDTCYVDKINTSTSFVEIGAVNESSFTETNDSGTYKQELTTFIQSLEAEKLSDILLAASNTHIVAFRTSQGKMYCFGSDGGASLTFSQVTGKMGETAGYSITLNKNSIYPLFETNPSRFNTIPVLGTENRIVVSTEDHKNAILIFANEQSTSEKQELTADQYKKGREGSVFITIPAGDHIGAYGILGYNYDTMQEQKGKPVEKTYKTIEIGEYIWTTENLKLKYTNLWGTQLGWMNFTQENINTILGREDVSVDEFENTYGTFISLYEGAIAYANAFTVYNPTTGMQQQGWTLPSGDEILQLIGQAPRSTDNRFDDVINFLCATNDPRLYTAGNERLNNGKNISGLSLTPLGIRMNGAIDNYRFADFGKVVALRCRGGKLLSGLSNTEFNARITPFVIDAYLEQFTQARYCRRLTDKELGYRLFIDEYEDKVLMLDADVITSLDELPAGLERGIALRYANRENKLILKSWTEIKNEATNMRSLIN